MNPVDEKFVDVDGIRTRYFEKGNCENLVLIHGGVFGSNDAADCSLDWGSTSTPWPNGSTCTPWTSSGRV